ncbi:MAG: bifunctional glutamate N-acetyltransferase/amino-acid acetyltransferase ArgJ [Lachnospiraceae bacterium]|nr:bifunctional glutamate N-acetyltransferase/amino-acid acetyltransferase ArgJ [Lachnospiraceae bacterium]
MDKFVSKEVSFEQAEGYRYIEGGICAAKGFLANGLNCGLNPVKEKNDLALFVSEVNCNAAAVYTKNKVKGAPIAVCREHLSRTGNRARAVIANSKNANTCNADGVEKAEQMCALAAQVLHIEPEEVLVASTGVIGEILPIEPIERHIKELADGLSFSGNLEAAKAIMTTDTVKKEAAVEFELDGKICRVGGMAKGSGMICPNMATTLNFITTDCSVSEKMLQKALSEIVEVTYNCLSIDGDTSTNDMVLLLANGLAGNKGIDGENESYQIFKKALYLVMLHLTKMLAKDGEGATKLLTCSVSGAPDEGTARTVAKSVISSSLFKCAVFGEDANWGRVLCAIGYADASFEIEKVGVSLSSKNGSVEVCRDGAGIPFSEEEAKEVLSADEILVLVDLGQGEAKAKAFGCDLTYDYVKINGDYRS